MATDALKFFVWSKGGAIPGFDSTIWRYDAFGTVIRFSDYGNRASQWGWEIDHIIPTVLGGTDALSNLRPLHCSNNASLGGRLSGTGGKR